MPWRFAAELNRVLEIGGLLFYATHQTWPLHAEPNDFYRFSDEALKFLFGKEAGFEIIDSHMEHQVWLYPEHRTEPYLTTPLFPGYGNSQVLARKVRHLTSQAGPGNSKPTASLIGERCIPATSAHERGDRRVTTTLCAG